MASSSQSRDRTQAPCVERGVLATRTTRKRSLLCIAYFPFLGCFCLKQDSYDQLVCFIYYCLQKAQEFFLANLLFILPSSAMILLQLAKRFSLFLSLFTGSCTAEKSLWETVSKPDSVTCQAIPLV